MVDISRKVLNQLIKLPDKTGVYLLKDEDGNVIREKMETGFNAAMTQLTAMAS